MTPDRRVPVRAIAGALAALQRLLPAAFRRQYGADLAWARGERLRDAGRTGAGTLLGVAFREAIDLVRTLVREWAEQLGRGPAAARGWGGTTHQVLRDLRHAARGLRNHPGFSSIAVLTLALGIGSTTAVFTVVDAVLFRSLPWEGAERLSVVWTRTRSNDRAVRGWVSYPEFRDLEDAQRSFEALGAYRAGPVTLTGPGADPTSVRAVYATHSLFGVAGVEPEHGRVYSSDEDVLDGERVVVLSHGLWTRRFGADADVLGATLVVDGDAHTIVGVMPDGYAFPERADVWLPAVPEVGLDDRAMHRLRVLARLAPTVTFDGAGEEVEGIAGRLEDAYPDSNTDESMWVEPLHEAVVSGTRPALLVLLGAVALVLAIVCANVANLVLVRAAGRANEVALRTALGASRRRLLLQFLSEGVVLAGLGGLLGVATAHLAVSAIVTAAPAGAIPRLSDAHIDGRVLAVVASVALATGVFFGLLPALRPHDGAFLRSQTGSSDARGVRARSALVILETALAVVLAFGAGLLVRSFNEVQRVDPGFEPEGLWSIPIVLPFAQYGGDEWPRVETLFRETLAASRSAPGVTAAALAYAGPTDPSWSTGYRVAGRPDPGDGNLPEAQYRPVSPGYFSTAGIRLIEGRDFDEGDRWNAPGVVIVNESFVREQFPNETPLGRRIVKESWWEGTPEGEWTIVGVAEDVTFFGRELGSRSAFYFPHAQRPMTEMTLLFRSDRDAADVLSVVREAVWRHDSGIPVEALRSAESALETSLAGRRLVTAVMSSFGALALALAAGGLFGVLSYTVATQRHQLGVRISLGAGARHVRAIVLGKALRLVGAGALLGAAAAWVLANTLSATLFGVGSRDPVTFLWVGATLLAASAVASYLPARRATRVDPVVALRDG